MNALVNIHGHAVPRLQYRNQAVLTLPMIDEIHGRKKESSLRVFGKNIDKFIEGLDYYKVPSSEWKPLLNTSDIPVQKSKIGGLNRNERHHQDQETNLEFPFPNSPPPAPQPVAPLPVTAARATSSKLSQPALPLPEPKMRGGRRGHIYFITQSGYALLVKVFNDPLAWAIQRELVRSYFHQKQSRARRLVP